MFIDSDGPYRYKIAEMDRENDWLGLQDRVKSLWRGKKSRHELMMYTDRRQIAERKEKMMQRSRSDACAMRLVYNCWERLDERDRQDGGDGRM